MQEEFEEDVKSKSQVKRDMLELTQLGTQLSELPSNELTRIPMGDTLRNAIEKAPSVTSNSARKRHLQYIGKLMRSADIDNIRAELNAISDEKDAVTRQLHAIEHWRDKLIDDDIEEINQPKRRRVSNANRNKQGPIMATKRKVLGGEVQTQKPKKVNIKSVKKSVKTRKVRVAKKDDDLTE